MYTFSEITKIFNNCSNWEELEQVSSSFQYLIENDWIKSMMLYNSIVILCDQAFRRIEKL